LRDALLKPVIGGALAAFTVAILIGVMVNIDGIVVVFMSLLGFLPAPLVVWFACGLARGSGAAFTTGGIYIIAQHGVLGEVVVRKVQYNSVEGHVKVTRHYFGSSSIVVKYKDEDGQLQETILAFVSDAETATEIINAQVDSALHANSEPVLVDGVLVDGDIGIELNQLGPVGNDHDIEITSFNQDVSPTHAEATSRTVIEKQARVALNGKHNVSRVDLDHEDSCACQDLDLDLEDRRRQKPELGL